MTFRGYKIHIILITCVVIIAIGFSAQKFVYGRHVTETLERDFAALAGVEAAELTSRGEQTDVLLHVTRVPDFPSLYRQALRLATERLQNGGEIVVADERNEALQNAYDRIHLALYEGAATGRFVRMERHVHDLLADGAVAGDGELTYELSVDADAVYIQLSDADGHLYERIARSDVESGGGSSSW